MLVCDRCGGKENPPIILTVSVAFTDQVMLRKHLDGPCWLELRKIIKSFFKEE